MSGQENGPRRSAIVAVTIEEQELTGSSRLMFIRNPNDVQTRIQRMDRVIAPPESFTAAVAGRLVELTEQAELALVALGWTPPPDDPDGGE